MPKPVLLVAIDDLLGGQKPEDAKDIAGIETIFSGDFFGSGRPVVQTIEQPQLRDREQNRVPVLRLQQVSLEILKIVEILTDRLDHGASLFD